MFYELFPDKFQGTQVVAHNISLVRRSGIGANIPYLTQYKTRTQYKTPPTVYDTPVVILGVSDRPSIYNRGYTI